MPTGRLKKWFEEKGFGFIAPDDATSDMFASRTGFRGANEADIKEGARVQFESELEVRTNKMKASTWAVSDGAGLDAAAAMAGLHTQLLGGLGAAGLAGLGIPGLAAPGLAGFGAIPGLATPQLGGIPGLSPYGITGLGAVPGLSLAGLGAIPGLSPALATTPGALPPGWEQVTDPATNRPYWCNRATGESSWTPPQAAAAPVLATATPGALPATGLDLAQQAATQVATGDAGTAPAAIVNGSVAPDLAAAAAAGAAAATALAPTASATPAGANGVGTDGAAAVAPVAAAVNGAVALPAGWEQATDPNTNRPYYFNRATGQTSWTIPA